MLCGTDSSVPIGCGTKFDLSSCGHFVPLSRYIRTLFKFISQKLKFKTAISRVHISDNSPFWPDRNTFTTKPKRKVNFCFSNIEHNIVTHWKNYIIHWTINLNHNMEYRQNSRKSENSICNGSSGCCEKSTHSIFTHIRHSSQTHTCPPVLLNNQNIWNIRFRPYL